MTKFGWSSTAHAARGELGSVSFGATFDNGMMTPWAYGPDAPALPRSAGSATWSGALAGVSDDARFVSGDADMTVDLGTHAGIIAFTGLEYGNGTTWGDGDLRYSLQVSGAVFVSTAGDDGMVAGAFMGREHQAAGGTLRRTDLAAGSGVSR